MNYECRQAKKKEENESQNRVIIASNEVSRCGKVGEQVVDFAFAESNKKE